MNQFLFDYLDKEKHMVSLVGAGGKTTIMYQLAEYFARKGKRVLVTTTTHILKPLAYYANSIDEAKLLWEAGKYAVVGSVEEQTGKLIPLPKELWQEYYRLADLVLVEADGAKGLPCKTPASHEPVIAPESDVVIGVVGLDGLGLPIKNACFRLEETLALLEADTEHLLNEADVAKLLLSEKGTYKNVGTRAYFMALNKCDSISRRDSAKKISALLREAGFNLQRLWIRGEAIDGKENSFL